MIRCVAGRCVATSPGPAVGPSLPPRPLSFPRATSCGQGCPSACFQDYTE